MDDLISRQAAIDAIEGTDWYHINKNGVLVHGANSETDIPLYKADDVYKVLAGLPSAERRGRWIDLKCDQCGQVDMSKPNYCPNCGARMEGEEE